MEHIDALLNGGGDIVTYRLLSRTAKVSVNEAKDLLGAYLATHSSASLHATFLLTGTHESTFETEIRIVPQDNLEAAKSQYTKCSSHVFSIANTAVNNLYNVLANVESKVNEMDNFDLLDTCRVLKNPAITYTDRPLFGKAAAPIANKTQQQHSMLSAKPSAPTLKQSHSATSAMKPKIEKKTPLTKSSSSATSSSKSSFFATQLKQDAERKEKQAAVDAAKQQSRDALKEKARAEATKDALKHRAVDETLMAMFDDGDDNVEDTNKKRRGEDEDSESERDEDDHETKKLKLMASLSAEPKSDTEEDAASTESMQTDSEKPEEQLSNPAIPDLDPENSVTVETITRRVRRRRKVVKKVHKIVGKFMESVDVEGWESYSDDEVVPVVAKPVVVQRSVAMDNGSGSAVKNEGKKPAVAARDAQPIPSSPPPKKAPAPVVSPVKPKGKPAGKKGAPQAGQKLISSFFKK
ncbi:DNA polymerase subunit Cdc27 [Chytriomyces cf. hyalinus JEL632]|nr:DNA polymerase subunit Cdc27 [Chytriomyces cf. hyalinus JEL632]